MTARPDAELEVLFTERVLGWKLHYEDGAREPEGWDSPDGDWKVGTAPVLRSRHGERWAFAGLRAHAEDWDWKVSGGRDDLCFASVWDEHGREFKATDPDLCRAIVLASCRAVGCEV